MHPANRHIHPSSGQQRMPPQQPQPLLNSQISPSIAQMYSPPMSSSNGVTNGMSNIFVSPSSLSNSSVPIQPHLYGQSLNVPPPGIRSNSNTPAINGFIYPLPQSSPSTTLATHPSVNGHGPSPNYSTMRQMPTSMATVPATGTVGNSYRNNPRRPSPHNIRPSVPSHPARQERMYNLPLPNNAGGVLVKCQQPNLKFSRCVFYGEPENVLYPPTILYTDRPMHEVKLSMSCMADIEITPEQAENIFKCCQGRDPNNFEFGLQVIVRFCQLNLNDIDANGQIKGNAAYDDSLPPHLTITVNDRILPLHGIIPNNKQYMDGRRSPKPINITPLLCLDAITQQNHQKRHISKKNTVRINWVHYIPLCQYYAMGIYLAFKVPFQQLARELSMKRPISVDQMKAMVRRRLSNKSDDDIVALTPDQTVNLKCPLLQSRISVPVRTAKCTHLQSFCLMNFLTMNDQKVYWKCSLCRESAKFDELYLDCYLDEILKSPSTKGINQISYLPDGTWATQTNESSDESEDEVVSKKPAAVEIIDLCSDESDSESHQSQPANAAATSSTYAADSLGMSTETRPSSGNNIVYNNNNVNKRKTEPLALGKTQVAPAKMSKQDVIVLSSDDEDTLSAQSNPPSLAKENVPAQKQTNKAMRSKPSSNGSDRQSSGGSVSKSTTAMTSSVMPLQNSSQAEKQILPQAATNGNRQPSNERRIHNGIPETVHSPTPIQAALPVSQEGSVECVTLVDKTTTASSVLSSPQLPSTTNAFNPSTSTNTSNSVFSAKDQIVDKTLPEAVSSCATPKPYQFFSVNRVVERLVKPVCPNELKPRPQCLHPLIETTDNNTNKIRRHCY